MLEALDDIYTFKFNPSDPNIVAGGCVNGQVVLWDISEHAYRLSEADQFRAAAPANDDKKFPVIHSLAVSSIETSHKTAITDLQWLPSTFEVCLIG